MEIRKGRWVRRTSPSRYWFRQEKLVDGRVIRGHTYHLNTVWYGVQVRVQQNPGKNQTGDLLVEIKDRTVTGLLHKADRAFERLLKRARAKG